MFSCKSYFFFPAKELLASLNETKAKSAAISDSLEESSRLQSELGKECDVYRPLADFGSTLYFATIDLGKLSSLYQLSITAFMRLFEKALKSSEVGPSLGIFFFYSNFSHCIIVEKLLNFFPLFNQDMQTSGNRLQGMQQRLLLVTFQFVSRSLFKADRLAFALHLTHKMCPESFKPNVSRILLLLATCECSMHCIFQFCCRNGKLSLDKYWWI